MKGCLYVDEFLRFRVELFMELLIVFYRYIITDSEFLKTSLILM